MTHDEWTAGQLLELSGGYWEACALHAGVRLGVFTRLGDERLTARETAARLGTSLRGTEALLNALAAMGLLEKREGRFGNVQAARDLLCAGSDHYLGHILLHHHHLMAPWSRLHEAVETGSPVHVRSSHTSEEAHREAFLMGMFNLASRQAAQVVSAVDLSGRRRLLDLGGGPGTYAIHFCLKNPHLSAVVFDLPTTRPFAEQTVARFGLQDRVAFHPGDFYADEFPGGFDAVWISQILHSESPDQCRTLLKKAAAALAPGGLLLVQEFLLDDTKDGPLHPALFSLNMLVGTEEGRAYSDGEVREMLADAGLTDIRRLAYESPSQAGILSGVAV